jgi:hypothetical protein
MSTYEDEKVLDAEIEHMAILARDYGLNLADDSVAEELVNEFSAQIDKSNRRDRSGDEALNAVLKVAARAQGKADLDAIRTVYGREPSIGENLKAAYKQPEKVKAPVQPPSMDSDPIKLLDYYYKHLSTSRRE